jgi:hypothetical protein
MTYNEWLSCIEELKKSNNYMILDKLSKENVNINLSYMLEPKLIDLIYYRFKSSITSIITNLRDMYSDQYYLDLILLNFRKDIEFIKKIMKLKQISEEEYSRLNNDLRRELNESYKLLEEEAVSVDDTGNLLMIIRNNRIKWSE